MKILLTGARAPVTLDLSRRFTRAGHEVFLADSLRFGCAALSNKKQRMCLVPRAKTATSAYIDALNALIDVHKIELLIPTCEEVFFLAAFKQHLACACFFDELEKLESIHNKFTFSRIASNEFAQSPETHLLENKHQLEKYRSVARDWVFKPVYSRFAAETLVSPTVKELNKIEVSSEKKWVAQRKVEGRELATYGVARDGELLAHSCYFSQHRLGKASGICFQNEHSEQVLGFVQHFVRDKRYTGQIGFDLILSEDGQLFALEGNPRATSGLHLFENDEKLVNALTNPSHHSEQIYLATNSKSQMVAIAMMIWGIKQALFRFRLGGFLKDFWNSRDVIWRWQDMRPTLGIPLTLAELVWVAIRERKTLPQASTFDIEWNGEVIE